MAKKSRVPKNYGPYVKPIDPPKLPTEAKKKSVKIAPKMPKKGGYC